MKPIRTRPARATAGMTIVETVLGLTLFVIMSGAAIVAASRGVGAFRATSLNMSVEGRLQRAMQRATSELLASSRDVITPIVLDDDAGSSDLTFQCAIDYQADAIVWGPVSRLVLEYDTGEINDGLDNNGDGLIDECALVLIRDDGGPNEKRVVLCHNVREFAEGEEENNADDNGNGVEDERGFNVHEEGGLLVFRMTVEEQDAEVGTIVRSLQTAVRVRN